MNTKQLIAAAALAVVGAAASAQTIDAFGMSVEAQQPSTLTREQVRAELVRSRAAGEVTVGEAVIAVPAPALKPSGVTRAQVVAELIQARAEGLDAVNAEYGYANNNFTSTRSREEVRAETLAALRAKRAVR